MKVRNVAEFAVTYVDARARVHYACMAVGGVIEKSLCDNDYISCFVFSVYNRVDVCMH